jgi:hypothetical protein
LTPASSLVSYKIRFHEGHVRAVPAYGPSGAPFSGPGVDLRGEDAARVIAAARPVIAWLEAREPGVNVRSISVRVQGPRVLVSLEPAAGEPKPRALRFEPPYASELRDAALDAERVIAEACAKALRRRQSTAG